MKLSNSAIAQIAKALQLAILTGTDVIDNLRMMRFSEEDGELHPDENYMINFDEQLESMIVEAETSRVNQSPASGASPFSS